MSIISFWRPYLFYFRDDAVSKTAIGVLGDLADTLGSNAGPLIQQSVSSRDFLSECLSSDDHLIRESAEWAKLAISRAISFWGRVYIVYSTCMQLGVFSRGLGLHTMSQVVTIFGHRYRSAVSFHKQPGVGDFVIGFILVLHCHWGSRRWWPIHFC